MTIRPPSRMLTRSTPPRRSWMASSHVLRPSARNVLNVSCCCSVVPRRAAAGWWRSPAPMHPKLETLSRQEHKEVCT